jgi:hypothetical protein
LLGFEDHLQIAANRWIFAFARQFEPGNFIGARRTSCETMLTGEHIEVNTVSFQDRCGVFNDFLIVFSLFTIGAG